MKIFITCPSFVPHGGIRVILEWVNRLSKNNDVILFNNNPHIRSPHWFTIDKKVKISIRFEDMQGCDCLIITSPHTIDFQDFDIAPRRIFIFMQMLEDLFRPHDEQWRDKCRLFYLSKHPMIAISEWNINHVMMLGRRGKVHYVGNGVNLNDFPLDVPKRDGKTILVEGWVPTNPSKDHLRIGPKVAKRLKAEGYYIVAYSQLRCDPEFKDVPDEYYQFPKLSKMNELYSRSSILLKASVCDARSCSPMEAMTKGCVTVRAIENGDDDLVHGDNCLRCSYNEEELYYTAKRLLDDNNLWTKLSFNCLQYVKEYNWDYWMSKIEAILHS